MAVGVDGELPSSRSGPLLTVVLNTFNRAGLVTRTLDAVLAQEGVDFEVVVVDDGSTDATPATLAAVARRDHRVRPVRQDNAGLSAARNTGLALASGAWVVFLDDDDVPDQGWLATLTRPMGDPGVGITCCGAILVDADGDEIFPLPVIELPGPFGGVRGAYRAGTFAVRTALCRQAGGYLDGLGTSHQFELFLRLQDEARRHGLRIESTDVNVLRIERRPPPDRSSSNPYIIYDATTWILARHPHRFATAYAADQCAAFNAICGNAAARMGDWPVARHHFWSSVRRAPRRLVHWQRLGLAFVPPVGKRVWTRHGASTHHPSTVGVPVQTEGKATTHRELFLPWRYEENAAPAEPTPTPTPGPGSEAAHEKLVSRLSSRVPDLQPVHLSPGLEHDPDPVARLHQISRQVNGSPALLTIADREATDPDRPFGPPSNPAHRREWTYEQFRLLLRSTGFRVERTWRSGDRRIVLVRSMGEPPTRTI